MVVILASGLWQDPAVSVIRVVAAVLLGSLGLGFMVMGLLASQDGGPQVLWWCLAGFLIGALGCLIGSVTAVLWWLGAWAALLVLMGFIFGLAGLVVLRGAVCEVLADFCRSFRDSRRLDAYYFPKPGQPRPPRPPQRSRFGR